MSRDSSHTYLHLHASKHADLFEEFTHPPSASGSGAATGAAAAAGGASAPNGAANTTATDAAAAAAAASVPGHFLPFEDIPLPPHLMPLNPEDEDDVVPDMHAAFGINAALNRGGTQGGQGEQQAPVWRDLGMERAVGAGTGTGAAAQGARREGERRGLRFLR